MLEQDNAKFRQQGNAVAKLESEIGRNRQQMKEMLEDMRDLEVQLEAKDKVIFEYKNDNHRDT